MNQSRAIRSRRHAHTLIELVAAMVCSVMLLGGLASVMLIARQVAYTPSAAARRTQAADTVNRIADELRYATLILQQTPQLLEFLVTDRNADGTAEKFRYEWSGVVGDPLYKTINGGAPVAVIASVKNFAASYATTPNVTTVTPTTDSAVAQLIGNTTVNEDGERDINSAVLSAQQVDPAAFTSAPPAGATAWNLTRVDFYGRDNISGTTLYVQLRGSGDPNDGPTSNVLGSVSIPSSSISNGRSWNTATFSSPVRGLALHRKYDVVLAGDQPNSDVLRLTHHDGPLGAQAGVLESDDSGASWQYKLTTTTKRQLFYRLYGTYTTPGTPLDVTRSYLSTIGLSLQVGNQTHSRVDARVPLANAPELLSAYWRADFDANPTTTNANGDAVADWGVASGSFDPTKLIGGIWYAASALETRPPNDFTTTTTVDVRCRNSSVGGNGAVMRINADRQGGQYGPLLVYLQLQADGTQTLSLHAKSSDAATSRLFARQRLPSGFVRYQLTIIPQSNVVNLTINGEDQGTFSYTTYAPAAATDRFLTLYANTSSAEFDYCDVRVGTN